MKTLACLLSETTEKFKAAGLEASELDARLLLQQALGLSREDLFLSKEKRVTESDVKTLTGYIERRLKREPVSRILGTRGFWKSDFKISPETLDPRPESEVLIETVTRYFSSARVRPSLSPIEGEGQGEGVDNDSFRFASSHGMSTPPHPSPLPLGGRGEKIDILDLGTGSGCLLLSLLQELPHARGVGIDISAGAVKTAEENAEILGLSPRATFIATDWNALKPEHRFDIVISNPPYIAAHERAGVQAEVALYDPPRALWGGTDGLDAYRNIINLLPSFLKQEGYVFFEIGATQGEAVNVLLEQSGFIVLETVPDLGRNDRCIVARAVR